MFILDRRTHLLQYETPSNFFGLSTLRAVYEVSSWTSTAYRIFSEQLSSHGNSTEARSSEGPNLRSTALLSKRMQRWEPPAS